MREEHLAEGETIVLQLRTHPKKIVKPVLLLVVLVVVLVALWAVPLPVDQIVLWFATAVLVLLGLVAAAGPFLRWRTTRYIVTNQRVALRTGIVTQTGRDIPLYRINNVTFEKQLSDRFFGCGTLVISDGTDQPGMVLDDVPNVEHVQRTLQDLVRQGKQLSDD
ncbi:PH domain-containing protein [Promicromonospora thailandica]|uniref:Membrane protein YdbS, contains bPH2 (Pleckstrin homology) domain n=1 Tax=Promicromonospora thailandica TaxID=765201 RepID=A0A9X2G138_9MICO|nr:PH domain-containing protein [Promicromonospora thailandica]MCP2265090.1 membrane protein YdbS, contains bPH2 (pleckstrin homology) domain [Promicromonospora thailandica]BFF19847.1 PH domain-containing protein [Promicromonospora thailandica]